MPIATHAGPDRALGVDLAPLAMLQSLLRSLFQLELHDLDFGIYRLLRVKHAEVAAFIDEQLPRAVDEAFSSINAEQREALERELDDLAGRIRKEVSDEALAADGSVSEAYRANPAKAVRELLDSYEAARARVDAIRTTDEQRVEVFNHLNEFFSRYYDEGDFVPKRRYGVREHYAVPYNGEETYLHWANRGQHYVKSGENFKTYAFSLDGDLLNDPCRVEFRLRDADLPVGNTKGDRRYFFPLADQVQWDSGTRTLVFPFHYRLPTEEEAAALGRSGTQQGILDSFESRLRDAIPDVELRGALLPARAEDDVGEAAYPPLIAHLRRFVRRNTTDYFIHRDLRGFLARELEFYLKDQVLHLADLDADLAARARTLKVLRSLAGQIITFLSQIEEVQRRLFEKRKFVLRTDYLVLMHAVPRELWPEVLANQTQIAEWERLFRIDAAADLFNPEGEVNAAFLEEHPTLVVDTSLFDGDFRDRVLESFDDIDEALGGILIQSENYQALRLLEARFREKIKCVYIDPPYNTGSDDFLYKDRYQHSSWMTMMEERLRLARELMAEDGVTFVSIDEKEKSRLADLMARIMGPTHSLGEVVWKNATDNNPTRIAAEHEYVLVFARDPGSLPAAWKSHYSYAKELLQREYEELAAKWEDPDQIERQFRRFIKDNAETIGKLRRYKHVDSRGPYTGSESVHNPHPGGYDYEIVHPETGQPMRKPANGYRFPESTMREQYIEKNRLLYGPDENRIVKIKLYLDEYRDAFRSVISLDGRLGAYALRDLFGPDARVFKNPKTVELIEQFVAFSTGEGDWVLDPMAGSGTTGEATLRVARADRSRRRFLLIEMGKHFDQVIVPRIVKLLYAQGWAGGSPVLEASDGGAAPALIKLLRLESYEDALHNLASEDTLNDEGPRAAAIIKARGDNEFRLRYMASLPLDASATMLRVDRLDRPFEYELEVLTDNGPERKHVDLVETFNLLYGLYVQRMERWINEADGGRAYRVVKGLDPDGARTMVLWRDMDGLEAAVEREFVESRLDDQDPAFDVVLINGDSTIPGVRSLDPVFKARMEEGEEWSLP